MAFKRKRPQGPTMAGRPAKRRRIMKAKRRRRRIPPTITPNSICRILRYVETISLNIGTSGIPAVYTFAANGLYDPNITGAGHQPTGFDQHMTMYYHYTVIGSRCRIKAFRGDTTPDVPIYLGIEMNDSSTSRVSSNTLANVLENKQMRTYRVLPVDASAFCTMNAKFSLRKNFHAGKGSMISEDIYRGNDAANPTELYYYHVYAVPYDAATDAEAVPVIVEIDYIVVFHAPKGINIS